MLRMEAGLLLFVTDMTVDEKEEDAVVVVVTTAGDAVTVEEESEDEVMFGYKVNPDDEDWDVMPVLSNKSCSQRSVRQRM